MSGGDPDVGTFPRPPLTFEDREGRTIAIRRYEAGPPEDAGERDPFDALVAMYAEYDPADRAQGIPPTGEAAVREWLGTILVPDGVNLLAWHGDRVAGHATLVPDEGERYELAIFVDQAYQGAGIGSRLIRALLGAGVEAGVGRVWLTVERWNRVAIELYRDVGFETTNVTGFEVEMARDL